LKPPPRATTTPSAASFWPGGVASMRYHLLPRRPAVKWVASTLGAQRECARKLVSGLLQTEKFLRGAGTWD
jgi:hypothetical protein